MPPDKERQLKALREMLDGIYLDATQSHATGTVPCDLTIIFTALASLTVSYDDVKEDVRSLKDSMAEVQTGLHEIATTIKVCDAVDQGKKAAWTAIIAFVSGGLGITLIKWILDTYLNNVI